VAAVAVIGSLLGAVVGYVGGFVDLVAMRAADVMLSFPTLLLALIVLYTLPAGIPTLIFVLAITRLAVYVRVARGDTLAVRQRLFVRASRALGGRPLHIIGRQILPVIAPTMGVLATLEFALMILAESSLSFLGIGVQPPNVTWGLLISEGSNYLLTAWWVALLPGIAITSTALAVNLLADWFRRAGEPS
jgi:peptide/nickel transport system permease protein